MFIHNMEGYFMKKNLLKILPVVLLGVLLVGCSSSKSSSHDKSQDNKTELAKPKNVKFAKLANSNQRYVWIVAEKNDNDSLGKDSIVDSVFVTKAGKTKFIAVQNGDSNLNYNIDSEVNMADLNKLNDQQIITKAEKYDKKVFDEQKKAGIQSYKDDIKSDQKALDNFYEDTIAAELKEAKQDLNKIEEMTYSAPQWKKLNIKAETDDSGNNISSEEVKTGVPNRGVADHNGTTFDLSTPLQNNFPIMKKYYTGYLMDDGDRFLILSTDKQASVSLDKVSTKGIKVDDDD